jgi:hypothetical protein
MFTRNDGLLRGSREERGEAMLSAKEAEWNLETVLDLHTGLLDHAQEVKFSAMAALEELAKRRPAPVQLTPVSLLSCFMFSFTVSSGMALSTFQFLVELDTPEARQAIEWALSRTKRNEDFSDFVGVLQRADKLEILRSLDISTLSKPKASILRSALG